MKLVSRQLLMAILFGMFINTLSIGQELVKSNVDTISKKEIYNKDFNWTIAIPDGFENVKSEEWDNIQGRGVDILEETNDLEVIDQNTTIFVFRSDQLNYFESSYQPFDSLTDGNYLDACKSVNDVLYYTFKSQMPDIKIDTINIVEKIDNLEFQTFKLRVEYPNNIVMYFHMFSRLFEKREFAVNIMYVDKIKGQQMLDSWTNSKFGR